MSTWLTSLPASEKSHVDAAAKASGLKVFAIFTNKHRVDTIQVYTDELDNVGLSPFWEAWRKARGDE